MHHSSSHKPLWKKTVLPHILISLIIFYYYCSGQIFYHFIDKNLKRVKLYYINLFISSYFSTKNTQEHANWNSHIASPSILRMQSAKFLSRISQFKLNKKYRLWGSDMGRYPALGHLVFFFKWEGNKYFSSYAYCFIFKSDLLIPNVVEKNSYFILFFLESYFFDEQSNFLAVRFYWNKKV